MQASVAPAIMRLALPIAINVAASPIACKPVAQAVHELIFGP